MGRGSQNENKAWWEKGGEAGWGWKVGMRLWRQGLGGEGGNRWEAAMCDRVQWYGWPCFAHRFLYCGVLLQAIDQDITWENTTEEWERDLTTCESLELEVGWRQGKVQWQADHRILPCGIRFYSFLYCKEFIWWYTRFEGFPPQNTERWTVQL